MFITIEGTEGSGKTTVAKELAKLLKENGHDVVHTREPGGTPISESIRNVILDRNHTTMDGRTEALLYAASRRQHLVEKIWPALKEGKVVLCDRFLDSSLAYQGYARGLGYDEVLNINLFATENTYPDLTLFFVIKPEDGLQRIAKNKNREVNRLDLEKLPFHQKVYDAFMELTKKFPERFVIIDASKTLPEVIDDAYNAIVSRMAK